MLVEELVRQGVTHFFAAPGSRSTPLIIAAARNPRAALHMHVDERGTAFQALGFARMSGGAAAWITTSGTALANGYPAIVEAALEHIPMILLTADRPPELRDAGANQTIRQVGLFGDNVVWETDLPVPTPDINPAFVLTTVSHAVLRSAEGPVHLNAMFREPFHTGEPHSPGPPPVPPHLASWLASGGPWTRHIPAAGLVAIPGTTPAPAEAFPPEQLLRDLLSAARRPLVVLGRMPVHTPFNGMFGQVPVLPDIGSQHRFTDMDPEPRTGPRRPFIMTYDALLRDRERWPELAPDLVIQVGRTPVSKSLQSFVAETNPVTVVLDGSRTRLDPEHRVRHRVHIHPGAALALLTRLLPEAPCNVAWAQTWHDLNAAATRWMADTLDMNATPAGRAGTVHLSEQAVVRETIRRLPETCPLVLASSNSIRHANTFADGSAPHTTVVANRGASGIDGTLATAAGAAAASGTRAWVILGDLALLHDLNSLALAEDLTIVVINNDGGGIFSMLPISEVEDVFESCFGTPHGRTFRAAAELFGLAWHNPESMAELALALNEARAATKGVLIEVTTDRADTARIQKELLNGLQTHLRTDIPLS